MFCLQKINDSHHTVPKVVMDAKPTPENKIVVYNRNIDMGFYFENILQNEWE